MVNSLAFNSMASNSTNLGSNPSKEPLPLEILLEILERSIQSNPNRGDMFRLLFLSRAVHHWIIPHLYYNLDLEMDNVKPLRTSNSIDRSVLLGSALPSSFVFTRHLISRNTSRPFKFSIFPQLTHLSLWGHNRLGDVPSGQMQAHAIVMLPLEELFVWETDDNNALLEQLSEDVTLWSTLRRFGCQIGFSRPDRPDERWLRCPNLVEVLVLFMDDNWFIKTVERDMAFPISSKFRGLVIAPCVGNATHHLLTSHSTLGQRVKDRRLIVLCEPPQHLFVRPESFWENQSAMWNILLAKIELNHDVQKMTMVNNLPWSEEDGFYILS
ncbi:hypothetical protein DL96DRAFT_1627242 [Flagelloscypha sp. PMI_526]|nr:hypothetical protein DL96DRAFT_1627242 [Flagelloscypha sp. PMI_526]